MKYFSLIFTSFAIIFSFSLHANEQFLKNLLQNIRDCVEYNDSIEKKDALLDILDRIDSQHMVLEEGSDALRGRFVLLQGCIEQALACAQTIGEIVDLVGVIHTPLPATPLCTKADNLDDSLLDESIRDDPEKRLTVRSRAIILRDYLEKGGILYIVYPKGGLERRSAEQQEIYLSELARYPGHLIDWVLNTSHIDPDMIGATYFFRNRRGSLFIFSIKARQANDPQELSEWGIWLGEIEHPRIADRIQSLFSYFSVVGGPQI